MNLKNNDHNNNYLKNWIEWFVGFTDAEGNFQVYPKKRVLKSGEVSKYNVGLGFHLSLHSRDLDIINTIHKNLNNIGTIYAYENRPEVRIAINDRSGLNLLIKTLENFPLITEYQLTRYLLLKEFLAKDIREFKTLEEFNKFKDGLISNIQATIKDKEPQARDLSNESHLKHWELRLANGELDNWIVGFINGEGSFYLNKGKCNFFIEHTNSLALELIKGRFSFGPNVLKRAPRVRDIGKNHIKTTYVLIVSSKSDVNNLIQFLDSNAVSLAGHKLIQYNEWKDKWVKG